MQYLLKTSVGELSVLHYKAYANKPTIVFLHESLGCIELWRDFPKRLGEMTQYNVLVYDRLGYGRSGPFTTIKREADCLDIEADILLEVLVLCKIDNTILFGHSDSGTIALIFGAKYPTKVSGIISEGAHVFVEEEGLDGIRQAVKAYETANLKSRLEKYHSNKTDDVFRAWSGTWLNDQFKAWNIEHYLPMINCPVLVIQGEEDEYGTLKQVDGIAGKVAGKAKKIVLPEVRHTPHKEVPETILQVSKDFISGLYLKKRNFH
jgi:pimeloyl-ACP methyl ester carboxylesterase